MGYAGGAKKNPTYHSLGHHTETLQVDYDPSKITYKQILQVFWRAHSPTHRAVSRQYRSVIFYHNEQQKKIAQESKKEEEARRKGSLFTDIESFSAFYLAEDYHQKYRLRQVAVLLREYQAIYPTTQQLIHSTAVARVNGYLGGFGTLASLQAEIEQLGLSATARQKLIALVTALQRYR